MFTVMVVSALNNAMSNITGGWMGLMDESGINYSGLIRDGINGWINLTKLEQSLSCLLIPRLTQSV